MTGPPDLVLNSLYTPVSIYTVIIILFLCCVLKAILPCALSVVLLKSCHIVIRITIHSKTIRNNIMVLTHIGSPLVCLICMCVCLCVCVLVCVCMSIYTCVCLYV